MNEKKGLKALIVGCSIAGSFLSLLLARKGIKVIVLEQKSREKIGDKVCANIVTSSFLKLLEEIGINSKKAVINEFSSAEFFSQNNSVELPVKDYEINRKELLGEIVKKAGEAGVKFLFNSSFSGFEKRNKRYNILFSQKGKAEKIEEVDYLIGADGALSGVAKKAGLFKGRKLWLAIQTKVQKKILEEPGFDFNKYCIFFNPKFGHYSYVFPSRDYFVIGTVSSPEKAKEQFAEFAKHLNIKKYSVASAVIPLPRKTEWRKGNILLLGDAACQTKFTGGGIVPAVESAFGIAELIAERKKARFNAVRNEIGMHQLITKVLGRMSAKDFDYLFDIAKKSRIPQGSRDELRKWAIGFVFAHPGLLRFLPKALF